MFWVEKLHNSDTSTDYFWFTMSVTQGVAVTVFEHYQCLIEISYQPRILHETFRQHNIISVSDLWDAKLLRWLFHDVMCKPITWFAIYMCPQT